MSTPNPFFKFFKNGRETFLRHFFQPSIPSVKRYENVKLMPLSSAHPLNFPLSHALSKRFSTTSFSKTPLSLDMLSTLLYWSAAETALISGKKEGGEEKVRRPYPSGGARYPLELYLCVDQEEALLGRGLYHYRPDIHAVEFVKALSPGSMTELKHTFASGQEVDAPVLILISFVIERGMPKYGTLAYKLGLIEAGHLCQNVYLVCTALGLACCVLGDFGESNAHDYLSIDGYNETLFYAVVIGKTKTE